MDSRERAVKVLSPDDGRSFKVCWRRINNSILPIKETGREEVHTVEAYEKRVHGESIEVD